MVTIVIAPGILILWPLSAYIANLKINKFIVDRGLNNIHGEKTEMAVAPFIYLNDFSIFM